MNSSTVKKFQYLAYRILKFDYCLLNQHRVIQNIPTNDVSHEYWSEKSAFCGQHLNSSANIFKDFLLSLTKLFFSCPFIFLVFSFNFSRITYALKRLKNFFKNFACEQCALNNWPRLGKVFHSLTSNNSKSLHAFELFFPVFKRISAF